MSILQLFKKSPSDEIIKELLDVTGFLSLTDSKTINRSHLNSEQTMTKYLDLQTKLATYYIPCKSKIYIVDKPTPKHIITIVRHFIKTKGYNVQSIEKYQSGNKIVQYKIVSKNPTKKDADEYIVQFT